MRTDGIYSFTGLRSVSSNLVRRFISAALTFSSDWNELITIHCMSRKKRSTAPHYLTKCQFHSLWSSNLFLLRPTFSAHHRPPSPAIAVPRHVNWSVERCGSPTRAKTRPHRWRKGPGSTMATILMAIATLIQAIIVIRQRLDRIPPNSRSRTIAQVSDLLACASIRRSLRCL